MSRRSSANQVCCHGIKSASAVCVLARRTTSVRDIYRRAMAGSKQVPSHNPRHNGRRPFPPFWSRCSEGNADTIGLPAVINQSGASASAVHRICVGIYEVSVSAPIPCPTICFLLRHRQQFQRRCWPTPRKAAQRGVSLFINNVQSFADICDGLFCMDWAR